MAVLSTLALHDFFSQHSLKSISPNGGNGASTPRAYAPDPALAEINITEWRKGRAEKRTQQKAPALAEINLTEWRRRSGGYTDDRNLDPALAEINLTEWRKASWRQLCDEQ